MSKKRCSPKSERSKEAVAREKLEEIISNLRYSLQLSYKNEVLNDDVLAQVRMINLTIDEIGRIEANIDRIEEDSEELGRAQAKIFFKEDLDRVNLALDKLSLKSQDFEKALLQTNSGNEVDHKARKEEVGKVLLKFERAFF